MRKPKLSPATPTAAFLRFTKMVTLLQKRGFSEKAITAFIQEKVFADIAHQNEKCRQPSLN